MYASITKQCDLIQEASHATKTTELTVFSAEPCRKSVITVVQNSLRLTLYHELHLSTYV